MPPRNITLPPVHNTRAPAQWEIISQYVDFDGKTVLDLGCGYGDLLWRAWAAGAKSIVGVDSNFEIQKRLGEIAFNAGISMRIPDPPFVPEWSTIRNYILQRNSGADIIFCFSVLPYLKNAHDILKWIFSHSSVALIECQYQGDGPGPFYLRDDCDMRRWLDKVGFKTVEPIGKTLVEGRGAYRTIWMCSD